MQLKYLSPLAKKAATNNLINIVNAKLHTHLEKGFAQDRRRVLDLAAALGVEVLEDGSIVSEALSNGDV